MRIPALATCLLLSLSVPLQAQSEAWDAEVREAAGAFVDAFNDLDWDRFTAAWAEDATVFFPMPGMNRVEGRDAIVPVFQRLFAGLPEQAEGPPYLSIDPRDLHVQRAGDMAVVTFHLGDEPPFSRRTLVFERREGRWRITHLHASRAPGG